MMYHMIRQLDGVDALYCTVLYCPVLNWGVLYRAVLCCEAPCRWQVGLAVELKKPLFMHCRDAGDAFAAILRCAPPHRSRISRPTHAQAPCCTAAVH
jgi:hypothetical protein